MIRERWRYSLQDAALLGAWSYSIYLIHYVILINLEFHGIRLGSALLTLVLASAYVSRLVEDSVRDLRRRLTGHSRPAATMPGGRQSLMRR